MLMTTYQHDYIFPHTSRYDFYKGKGDRTDQNIVECQCIEENKVDLPKAMEKQCNIEWTGVAPMGRLIDPRIIPTKFSKEQVDAMTDKPSDCLKEQSNRFLKTLRTAYPDLYEHLKKMPKEELNRRLERDRMYTTYQIDFCNINEYPEGIYESLKVENETSKLNTSKLLKKEDPCAELRTNVIRYLNKEGVNSNNNDTCENAYKPLRISFADSSRFINSGDNSHWRSNAFTKRLNFTEYMDSINKIGCVIVKNNIHNHKKCTEKHCRHPLVHGCSNLK